MTPPFDSETARAAVLRRWAMEPDPTSATEAARRGLLARFERQVDPEGVLPPAERERRAKRLLRAHMILLARKSRAKRALRARPK